MQARLKNKNTHKSKDALEENMGGGAESYRRGEKTLLTKNINKSNNESSRVMLNAISQNAVKPDRTS